MTELFEAKGVPVSVTTVIPAASASVPGEETLDAIVDMGSAVVPDVAAAQLSLEQLHAALAAGESDAGISEEELGRLFAFASNMKLESDAIRESALALVEKAYEAYTLATDG